MGESADKQRDWWSEIRHRGMFHVAGLYLVSAWLLVQIVDVLSQGPLPMPPEAIRLVWIALILIFPIALIFGWRYDITREGLVHTDPRAKGGLNQPLKPADHGIIAALSMVVAGIVGSTAVEIMEEIEHARLRDGIGVEEAVAPPPANSIAVLPFTTCSGQEEDAILAAGLASEVIDRLASLKKFKVIARASSFTMAGFDLPFVKIAKPLGVKYLLTGVLCRDGETLALRVELVDDSGYVAWTGNFEQKENAAGRLTLTLAAQVTEGVATALGQSFASKPENPVDPRADQELEIGREWAAREDFDRARAAFDKALEYDPGNAEAVFGRAYLTERKAFSQGDFTVESIREAWPEGQKALELARARVAAESADFRTHKVIAWILYETGKWDQHLTWREARNLDDAELTARLASAQARFQEAESHFKTALSLNPSDSETYDMLAYTLERQGVDRRAEALTVFEKALARDPFNTKLNRDVSARWAARGRYRQAMELLDRFDALPRVPSYIWHARLELQSTLGYDDEFADSLIDMLRRDPEAIEHVTNYLHLCAFPDVLAELGLDAEAEDWYRRLEKIPVHQGFASVERGWCVEGYMFATGQKTVADEVDNVRAKIDGMTDDEILDEVPWATEWLVRGGDFERATRLLEAQQVPRFSSPIRAEREPGPRLMLAGLYQAVGRDEDAAQLLEDIVTGLEAEYDGGIRHPATLANLAQAYVMQGHDDEGLDMLRKAVVDYHYRIYSTYLDAPCITGGQTVRFDPWKRLRDDTRLISLCKRIDSDLRQQAERIRETLAQYDLDELLAPAMAYAENTPAGSEQRY